jgi:hypothetical protein
MSVPKRWAAVLSSLPWEIVSVAMTTMVTAWVYLNTLAPGLVGLGDSPKFQFIGWVGGIPHSTGYPLYILISKAFVHLMPTENVAYAANLM